MTVIRHHIHHSWHASLRHLLAIGTIAVAAATVVAQQRPNVVFILTDDQRSGALSCMGHPHLKTPHIDRLAAEGVLFRNHFCTTSLCSPSRASILGGLYAHAHGVVNNFTDYPLELPTFPRQLQSAGYATAYIGKWHMGENDDSRRPGFDHFVTHRGQGKYFDNEFRINDGNREIVPGYYTTVVTDMAIDWLTSQKASRDTQPFLLMIGHKAPHSFYYPEKQYEHTFDDARFPYPESAFDLQDKPAWITQRLNTWHGIFGPLFDWRKDFPDQSAAAMLDFERMVRAYLGTILSVDDSVGRLREFLEQNDELDNTLFIFTSDNGLLEGEHGMVDKRTAHEGSLRIPLVVRYPELIDPEMPKVIDAQTLTIDFAPSILDLCSAPPLPNTHGQSWRKLVQNGDANWRTSWYYEYNYEVQFPYTPNVRGLRTDRWKYIRYPHGDGTPDRHLAELYDLQHDPDERFNLINDPGRTELIAKLRAELNELIAETHGGKPDQMPMDQGIKGELPDKAIR
ncbi:MAG: sulfatase [Planctomycetota bacterium]